jgi:hypothetical protein
MATPADQRLLELLDLWLRSLELHLQYVSLDDASYAQIQAWPAHQRPSRWILDLAKKKTLAVRAQIDERIEAGDTMFAESLETMIFLANLVGSQSIERFVPLAEAGRDVVLEPTLKAEAQQAPSSATATREMPKFPLGSPTAHAPAAAFPAETAAASAPAAPPREQVLADAERLLQWGRKWYELAELIARMANRPPLPEVRRILQEYKSTLDRSKPRA